MQAKTWPYGTTRKGVVEKSGNGWQIVVDATREAHVLMRGAQDDSAEVGDRGTLTFTDGGPTGGYWKFVKDRK